MDRTTSVRRRSQPPRSATRRIASNKYELQRPSIPNALSTAYGAPGRIVLPQKIVARPPGSSMLQVMKAMMEEDENPEITTKVENEEEEDEKEEEEEEEEEEEAQAEEEEEEQEESDDEDEEEEEELDQVDELEVDEDDSDYDPDARRNVPDSPFVAVRNGFKKLWQGPDNGVATSFVTEDKIASEARIARPGEPLARRLLRLRDKIVNAWYDLGGESIFRVLSLLAKLLLTGLLLLSFLVALRAMGLNGTSVSNAASSVGSAVTSPIHSVIDTISSFSKDTIQTNPGIQDDSQFKAIKDATSTQLKQFKSRLDNIESTFNRLLARNNKPVTPPERKVNLFAPRSEMVIDPYLTSPTREIVRSRGIAKRFARWKGSYPPSIYHGPITAFTPWDDVGDCWCSPDSGGRAQIVVDIGRYITPKELIVEHVQRTATLQYGSAPKDIELWAEVTDGHRRDAIIRGALDYSLRQDMDDGTGRHFRSLDHQWVKIGRWQYDINDSSHIQSFDIPVPLEDFRTPIRRVAFRTTSNWGQGVDHVCLYRLKLHGVVEAEREG